MENFESISPDHYPCTIRNHPQATPPVASSPLQSTIQNLLLSFSILFPCTIYIEAVLLAIRQAGGAGGLHKILDQRPWNDLVASLDVKGALPPISECCT
mmetsp:Transcript_38630/g.69173  ORF Transcript_38630/g.69173 Transcript_38630/m.69173 type:complete len:99 (+) Transcript_38630:307-603(+)